MGCFDSDLMRGSGMKSMFETLAPGLDLIKKQSLLLSDDDGAEWCSVYFPMSYQVGGFTLIVPEGRVVELDWSFEEAMRYVLTAGVKSPQGKVWTLPLS